MIGNLIFSSMLTLGILFSFVFFVLYLIAFYVGALHASTLLLLTIATNIVLWFVSPYLTDFMQRIFYRVRWVEFDAFRNDHPQLADFVKEVCGKHNLKIPRLRIIEDNNPTAFCYGSYPNNSRIVVSEGIFKYLTVEEQKAVVAHELGHIVNRDFIIMTVAVTLLQLLYEIYYILLRKRKSSGSGKKKDPTPLIGFVSYILYIIGSYLVLYLSRTREYLADRFSAQATGDPDSLSMALVKIAYGIARETDTESTQRLLESTRTLGIYDYKAAQSVGTTFKVANEQGGPSFHEKLTKVFLFDIYSPWALVSEINSTHPLTGKRIKMLSAYAKETGKTSVFDFAKVSAEGAAIDRTRLYKDFAQGIFIYVFPAIMLLCGLSAIALHIFSYPYAIMLFGAALCMQGLYRFQKRGGAPERTTVFELMQDPYANPMTGRFVEIQGNIIGKADAGSYLGEDVKMEDSSGCLIYLNYESMLPIIGNIIFGLGKAKAMIGTHAKAIGWFRRSAFQIIDLDTVETPRGTIRSYTRFWGIIMGIAIVAVGVFLLLRPLLGM